MAAIIIAIGVAIWCVGCAIALCTLVYTQECDPMELTIMAFIFGITIALSIISYCACFCAG